MCGICLFVVVCCFIFGCLCVKCKVYVVCCVLYILCCLFCVSCCVVVGM